RSRTCTPSDSTASSRWRRETDASPRARSEPGPLPTKYVPATSMRLLPKSGPAVTRRRMRCGRGVPSARRSVGVSAAGASSSTSGGGVKSSRGPRGPVDEEPAANSIPNHEQRQTAVECRLRTVVHDLPQSPNLGLEEPELLVFVVFVLILVVV